MPSSGRTCMQRLLLRCRRHRHRCGHERQPWRAERDGRIPGPVICAATFRRSSAKSSATDCGKRRLGPLSERAATTAPERPRTGRPRRSGRLSRSPWLIAMAVGGCLGCPLPQCAWRVSRRAASRARPCAAALSGGVAQQDLRGRACPQGQFVADPDHMAQRLGTLLLRDAYPVDVAPDHEIDGLAAAFGQFAHHLPCLGRQFPAAAAPGAPTATGRGRPCSRPPSPTADRSAQGSAPAAPLWSWQGRWLRRSRGAGPSVAPRSAATGCPVRAARCVRRSVLARLPWRLPHGFPSVVRHDGARSAVDAILAGFGIGESDAGATSPAGPIARARWRPYVTRQPTEQSTETTRWLIWSA